MVSDLSQDLRATLGMVKAEVVDLSAILHLTMRVVGNKTSIESVVQFKVLKPKPFSGSGVRDAMTQDNFVFTLKQYFHTINIVTEKIKITLATMHLANNVKMW